MPNPMTITQSQYDEQFKTASSKYGYDKIKFDNLLKSKNIAVVANNPINIPKVNYGDNSSITNNLANQNNTSGVGLSSGGVTTPKAAPKFDDDLVFGITASNKELASGGKYLAKRNDYLAQDYYYNNPSFNQDTIDNDLYNYLKGKGMTGSQTDMANTVRAIKTRMSAIAQPDPLQDELDTLDKKYAREKDTYLAGGIYEDKYTNFNDVNNEITNVTKIAADYVSKNKLKGMPSDADIQNIATQAGVTFDRAKRIMEGYGYETLKMQPEFEKETNREYNRNLTKLETEKNRQLEDLNTQIELTKQKISRQQQDIMKQAERNMSAMTMLGALRGYTNTSGFLQGITQVHQDALTLVSRLQAQLDAANAATGKAKARLLEDYQKALTQAKEDLDIQTRDINVQMGTKYASILNQYSGDVLYDKLKEFNSDLLGAKIDVVSKYVDVMGKLNQQKYDDLDQIMKMTEFTTSNQQKNLSLLTQNDGQILQNYSLKDLSQMYNEGNISLNDYKMLQSAMLTKAQNTLYDQGTPTSEDFDTLASNLEKGLSVHDAIVATIQNSGGRLEPLTTRKGETSTGKKTKGAARDRAIRHNNPTAMTTDAAHTLGLKEGEDYKEGDAFVGGGGKIYHTARFIGDGLQTTIKALDTAAKDPNKSAFYTASGQPRWQHTAIPDAQWLKMTQDQKEEVVKEMFDHESAYSREDYEGNKGKATTADGTDMYDEINNGFASASDITKYLKENKINRADFVTNYIKQADKNVGAIADKFSLIKTAMGVTSKDEMIKFITETEFPIIRKTYGQKSLLDYLLYNYKSDDPDKMATSIAAIYKGQHRDEDEIKTALDKAGFSRSERNKIYDKVESLLGK